MVGNSSVCCTAHTVIATPVLGRPTRLQPTWSIASIASRIVTNCLLVAAAFRSSTMRSPSATASQYCYGTRHRTTRARNTGGAYCRAHGSVPTRPAAVRMRQTGSMAVASEAAGEWKWQVWGRWVLAATTPPATTAAVSPCQRHACVSSMLYVPRTAGGGEWRVVVAANAAGLPCCAREFGATCLVVRLVQLRAPRPGSSTCPNTHAHAHARLRRPPDMQGTNTAARTPCRAPRCGTRSLPTPQARVARPSV